MGTQQHHAIIVTTCDSITDVQTKAEAIGCVCVGPSEEQINGYATLCIVPDGSKEWWPDSDAGNRRRAALREWLKTTDHTWVEVAFGELGSSVVDGSDLHSDSERE